MSELFQLEEVTSVPGSRSKRLLKTFEKEESAIAWLEDNDYELNENLGYWERKDDQEDGLLEVWVYVDLKPIKLE